MMGQHEGNKDSDGCGAPLIIAIFAVLALGAVFFGDAILRALGF